MPAGRLTDEPGGKSTCISHIRRIGLVLFCAFIPVLLPQAGYSGPVRPDFTYRVVHTYPHDSSAFTQGLIFDGGFLYESTGEYGMSSLRKVELETGRVLRIRHLPEHLFGEGITLSRGRIIQLTWRSGRGFVYDKNGFELLRTFHYPVEGWGLTYDGKYLIMSDGSSFLYLLNPMTFQMETRIQVHDETGPVSRLNELEYIQGSIYANVWKTNRIAKIDPSTGKIVNWIDVQGILTPEEEDRANVLNGIAYDAVENRIFITGKLWPRLFEVEFK